MNYVNKKNNIIGLLISIFIGGIPLIIPIAGVLYLILGDIGLAIESILYFIFYSWVHEIGHIVFLKKYKIDFTFKSRFFKTELITQIDEIERLTVRNQIFLAVGGGLFGVLFAFIWIAINFNVDNRVILGIITILNETNNLIFGEDGKILQEVITNKKTKEKEQD